MRDRAVSTAVTWALTMLITTLLISGLLIATGDQIRDRTDSVTRAELDVVGQRVAADLSTADRLASTGADTVTVETDLPGGVASGGYTVAVVSDGQNVTVVARTEDTAVRVPVANRTAVREATVRGGDLEIRLDGGALEVRRG